MYTQDAGEETTLVGSALDAPHKAPRRPSRLQLAAGLILVILVAGAAAGVFAQLAQRQGAQSRQPTWVRTLTGYSITNVVGTASNRAMLYACATPWRSPTGPIVGTASSNGTYTNPPYTILRSADGGSTWRDVGAQAKLAGACQIAVNPANADEVYAVSVPQQVRSGAAEPSLLIHTSDGGASWSAILPTLNGPYFQGTVLWSVQQLSAAGGHLFGLQGLPTPFPPGERPEPAFEPALERLVTSADGGRTWTVIDPQFHAAWLGVRSYAVDPTRPATIFILVGRPNLPIQYEGPNGVQLPASPPQPIGTGGDLYKTADGGATWYPVLHGLPFGMTVRLAAESPATVYVGGSASPVPLTASASGPQGPVSASGPVSVVGGFQLHVSRDSGVTWRDAAQLPVHAYTQDWLAAPTGNVFLSVTGVAGSGSGSGGSGTAVPGSPGIVPPAAPGKAGGSSRSAAPPVVTTPPNQSSPASGPLAQSRSTIYRYDPSANAWSKLDGPQAAGTLVGVTATANGGTALWFMAEAEQNGALYRAIV